MSDTIRLRKKGASAFLGEYEVGRQYLQRPEPNKGVPGLRVATDLRGRELLLKDWPRNTAEAADDGLRDMWQNEVRQLHQLAAHPVSGDSIVRLSSSASEKEAFYLLLEADRRLPLATLQSRGNVPAWLRSPLEENSRALIWMNIRRLAIGLDLLHSQGLLHRNLSSRTVLTRGDEEPDFLLTGFEWSMRLISAGSQSTEKTKPWDHSGTWESFATDWHALGTLTKNLFKVNESKLSDLSIPSSSVSPDLRSEEIRLLRTLLGMQRSERPFYDTVIGHIDSIGKTLSLHANRRGSRMALALRIGQANRLSEAIREASGRSIEVDDAPAQMQFIRNDLRIDSTVIATSKADDIRLSLRGSLLCYHLSDYRANGIPSDWALAYCAEASPVSSITQRVIGEAPFAAENLDLMGELEARQAYQRLRNQRGSWMAFRKSLTPKSPTRTGLEAQFHAFLLNQVLEGLLAMSEAFPVELRATKPSAESSSASYRLDLAPRADGELEEISTLWRLDPPATRLKKALLDNDEPGSRSWILTESPVIDDTQPGTQWRFDSMVTDSHGECFRFSGDEPHHLQSLAYLVRSDSTANDLQLRRKMTALKAFKTHNELALTLYDPRAVIKATHEVTSEDSAQKKLDSDKQEALKQIIATLPLFLVQGPPGVGKTRLVAELVRRRFEDDNSVRMLFTAQSHHAVDHLRETIKKALPVSDSERPLLIRCRSQDADRPPTPDDLPKKAQALVRQVLKSARFQKASAALQNRGRQLSTALSSSNKQFSHERRALEGLVLRSAHMVFSSSNAADLERLIEERSTFDWSIVEEAAKATGTELLNALLLSHRRLLIGDHQQLPPFGSERFRKLLSSPAQVQKALALADMQLGRVLRDATINELLSEMPSEDTPESLQAIADLAARSDSRLFLFESLILEEFERQHVSAIRPIAKKLLFQHRMHPAMAAIISEVFYNGELKTDPEREAAFKVEIDPIVSIDPTRLPNAPIVWVDMPWIQSTKNLKVGEQQPGYHNAAERGAVLAVLHLLAAREPNPIPSLAVLSPYAEQVTRLAGAAAHPRLQQHLKQFRAASHTGQFVGTVDSFQGNEADVVVLSLVRNNRGGTLRSSLGFLADPRRVNVMLSRARWRMVIVGSRRFLQECALADQAQTRGEQTPFLPELLAALNRAEKQGTLRFVPAAGLIA